MRSKHSPIVELQFTFHCQVLSNLFYYYNVQFENFLLICSFLPSLHFFSTGQLRASIYICVCHKYGSFHHKISILIALIYKKEAKPKISIFSLKSCFLFVAN